MARGRTRTVSNTRTRPTKPPALAASDTWRRRALDAIRSTVSPTHALDTLLADVDAFRHRHEPVRELPADFERYAREFAATHLDASRRIGTALEDRTFTFRDHYLKPWRDLDLDVLLGPRLRVFVPDRPGSSSPADLRYALEWTTQLPPLVNEFDVAARAVRWRDQTGLASKVDGSLFARFATNGDVSDVQAGVGVLFKPTSRRLFQFRPLILWRSWVSISADAPPTTPYPIATVQTHSWARLVAQSWRADGSDFRTDAVKNIDLVDYVATTPNRVWATEDSGVATPGAAGWLELPADRNRVYALWAIIRGWSRSTYAPPSLSSAITYTSASVPFMIVEHV